jgi:hypothetical protein
LNAEQRARQHWHELTPEQKREAVLDLIDSGMGEYAVSGATGLSIEQIRGIVGDRREAEAARRHTVSEAAE